MDIASFPCDCSIRAVSYTHLDVYKRQITKGTKAPQAAGKIHSDFERGFIKAEVVYYQDLLDCGSYNGAKEKRCV